MQAIAALSTGCHIIEDPWLGGILGCLAGRLDYVANSVTTVENWQLAIREFRRTRGDEATKLFLSAKVDTSDIQGVALLAQTGMYVVDVNVTLERRLEDGKPWATHRPTTHRLAMRAKQANRDVRIARAVDAVERGPDETTFSRDDRQRKDFIAIASSSFRYSRFHLDPALSEDVANEIKASWFTNSLAGQRGDQVWLAWWQGRPAGFLTSLWMEPDNDGDGGTAVIDLIAVAPQAQGVGIGQALTNAFLDHYADKAPCRLRVGTQVVNMPAQGLYLACGFGPVQATYVLHGHFGC